MWNFYRKRYILMLKSHLRIVVVAHSTFFYQKSNTVGKITAWKDLQFYCPLWPSHPWFRLVVPTTWTELRTRLFLNLMEAKELPFKLKSAVTIALSLVSEIPTTWHQASFCFYMRAMSSTASRRPFNRAIASWDWMPKTRCSIQDIHILSPQRLFAVPQILCSKR